MKKWTQKKIRSGWEKLRPHHSMSKFQKTIRLLAITAITGALAMSILLFFYTIYLLIVLPNPTDLREMNLTESTLIMDREGNLLYAIHGDENRESLDSLDEISPWLVDATVSIEDDNFYHHIGIDIPAIARSVLAEVGIGSPRGGSTITQQFVKNTFLSSERTYKRKFQEILLSLLLEIKFSKDEILLMYLNAIPYGSNAYGIELAANRYFDKDATDLTLAESAILAGIPQAPTRYSPYGNYRHSVLYFELTEDALSGRKITSEADLDEDEYTRGLLGTTFELPDGSSFYVKGRTDLVLDRMEELGVISTQEKETALEEANGIEFQEYKESIKAPHFVLWVKQMLEEKYGAAVVEQGGLKVYTTLDPAYQEAAENAVAEKKDSNASSYGASDAAMISIQPQTGQILAMVGSADYFDDEIDGQVNMITSARQPGSSFKPFVYALALLNQFTPATVIYDVPTKIGTDQPDNYDGTFMGPLSIRSALALSRNIPAAKAYFMAGQEEAIIPFVKTFGMDSIRDEGNYGWTLALGTAEVTPLEMAGAYSVFANQGYYLAPTPILKIENADGEILEEWKESEVQKSSVLDPQVAYLINDILSDPSVNLGPNVRIDSLDNAAKTGTSNTTTDSGKILPNNTWSAAYTPSLVTITWAGNADGSPMNGNASGYSTAAPIWKSYMNAILDKLEPTNWNRPAEIVEMAVSKASGLLPSENTPSDMVATEIFASFAVPTEIDNSFVTLPIETVTNRLANEYSPADMVEEKTFRIHRSVLADIWPGWQDAINKWASENGDDQPPTEYADDIHTAEHASHLPQIAITSPSSLSSVPSDTRMIDVDVELLDAGNGLGEVEFYMNDNLQYHASSAPYSGKIRIPTSATNGTIIEIKARAVDIYGYSGTSMIQVKIGDGDGSESDEPAPTETLPSTEEAVVEE